MHRAVVQTAGGLTAAAAAHGEQAGRQGHTKQAGSCDAAVWLHMEGPCTRN